MVMGVPPVPVAAMLTAPVVMELAMLIAPVLRPAPIEIDPVEVVIFGNRDAADVTVAALIVSIVGVVMVGEVDITTVLLVPVVLANSLNAASQSAAVVRVVPTQVNTAVISDGITLTRLLPDELTVRDRVLLLSIWNVHPVLSVLVTGRVIVCARVPVND
jgi:hypothetical protein